MIDVNELLAPLPGPLPCGIDLEDDGLSAAEPALLPQQAALFNLDALYSEARRADAEDSAWAVVLNQATELLRVNKHLRVAVYLCDAAMRRQRLEGLARSLGVIRKICETYWDDFHPLAAAPGGKQARVNILSGLGGNSFLAGLRNMPFVDGEPGATLKAYEASTGAGPGDDAAARNFARSVLVHHPKEQLDAALLLADEAADHVHWISTRIDSEYSPDGDVDCGEFLSGIDGKLTRMIETIRQVLRHATGAPADAAPAAAGGATAAGIAAAPVDTGGFSKERIRPMLDQIIDYYRDHEPSSPVPLLLLRAKRLMDLSFIDLVNDTVGDDAVRKAQQILGVGKEGG
jgi:type VI secretion system protein ImpA